MTKILNKTPLHKAVEIGNLKIVQILLNGKDINSNKMDSI